MCLLCKTVTRFNYRDATVRTCKSLSVGAKPLATSRAFLRISFKLLVSLHSAACYTPTPPPASSLLNPSCVIFPCANAVAPLRFTMPPRLQPAQFPASAAPAQLFSCPAARPQTVSLPLRSSRQFSQTPCPQVTLRRRKFYEWLNGPGRQLKEPIPDSTNYLGAYDKYGNLVRAGPGWSKDRGAKAAAATKTEKANVESEAPKPAEDAAPSAHENLEELEAAIRSGDAENKEASKESEELDDGKLPPETAEDLRPFPLNQYFRSQPVLSEDLREAIYRRVKKDGATVALASVEFGVSNERVGAVVRLKQMEKEWVAQVCSHPPTAPNTLPTT